MFDVHLAQYILLTLGLAFAGYLAYQAFDTPPVQLGDDPALPRYMTQPNKYRLGVMTFVGTCLVVYILIFYFHKELLPIAGALNPALQHAIETWMKDGSFSYPLGIVVSMVMFLTLLKVDKDWNPIFVLRRVVHGWVSIPQIANALMIAIRDQLDVPCDGRALVARDPDTPDVTIGDFEKGRFTPDRKWAELCYIRLWLERHYRQGSHFLFFNEPNFKWQELTKDYDSARERIAGIKRGEVTKSSEIEEVAEEIGSLRGRYCRLAACFLVYTNETQKDALSDARQFGVTITPDQPGTNPLRYTAIFVAAIVVAIYIGVSLSAMVWDLLHHNPVTVQSDIATRWMYYALANYGMPIIVVLLLRYLGWRSDRSQPNSYLISYATVFLVALCVASVCLAAAQLMAGQVAIESLGPQLYQNIKWGISPAVVAIYVAYHVDRQIDPLLPEIGSSEHWQLPQRLMSCVFFAILVSLFSLLPTLSISVSRSPWPVPKLQIVILGTTFIVGLTMALVGEFLLVAPTPASDPSRVIAAPVAGGIGAAKLRPKMRWAFAGTLMVAMVTGLAVWIYSSLVAGNTPQWAFERKPLYLGEGIPLAWTYDPPAPSAPAHFEVESRRPGERFALEVCTDAQHYHVNRINATREWRVRAVADCGKEPASEWSQPIEITQFDSIYQRIKSTGQVDVFVSNSQEQDVFKWSDKDGDKGVDIDLTNFIVRNLSVHMGRDLKLKRTPVSWDKLLPDAGDGSAAFAISSITKTVWRETKFPIQFTDSYYCTTYALIYRAGTQESRIGDMIKGKTVGVQRETTSARLADKLVGDGLFTIKTLDDTETMLDHLRGKRIDLGVTDTSFAQSAQLGASSSNNQLKFKEFGQDDLPSLEDEPTQQYAIAVHKGEIELLVAINETLAKAKQDGELAKLFKAAGEKYEAFKHFAPGSRSLGQHPWECVARTIAGR